MEHPILTDSSAVVQSAGKVLHSLSFQRAQFSSSNEKRWFVKRTGQWQAGGKKKGKVLGRGKAETRARGVFFLKVDLQKK